MAQGISPLWKKGVTNGAVSSLLEATVLKLARFVGDVRQQVEIDGEREILFEAIAQVSPDRNVKHGVFQSMVCSSPPENSNLFFAPLLGCYEQELQPRRRFVSSPTARLWILAVRRVMTWWGWRGG